MLRNIASVLQPKVLRTNDSSNGVLIAKFFTIIQLVLLKQTRVKKK